MKPITSLLLVAILFVLLHYHPSYSSSNCSSPASSSPLIIDIALVTPTTAGPDANWQMSAYPALFHYNGRGGWAEYSGVTSPFAPAWYILQLEMAAEEVRPLTMEVNGKIALQGIASGTTGTWNTAQWFLDEGLVELPAGPVIIRLSTVGLFPHLKTMRLKLCGMSVPSFEQWSESRRSAFQSLIPVYNDSSVVAHSSSDFTKQLLLMVEIELMTSSSLDIPISPSNEATLKDNAQIEMKGEGGASVFFNAIFANVTKRPVPFIDQRNNYTVYFQFNLTGVFFGNASESVWGQLLEKKLWFFLSDIPTTVLARPVDAFTSLKGYFSLQTLSPETQVDFGADNLFFSDCGSFCQLRGGTRVVIHDVATHLAVTSMMTARSHSDVWLGAASNSGTLCWVDDPQWVDWATCKAGQAGVLLASSNPSIRCEQDFCGFLLLSAGSFDNNGGGVRIKFSPGGNPAKAYYMDREATAKFACYCQMPSPVNNRSYQSTGPLITIQWQVPSFNISVVNFTKTASFAVVKSSATSTAVLRTNTQTQAEPAQAGTISITAEQQIMESSPSNTLRENEERGENVSLTISQVPAQEDNVTTIPVNSTTLDATTTTILAPSSSTTSPPPTTTILPPAPSTTQPPVSNVTQPPVPIPQEKKDATKAIATTAVAGSAAGAAAAGPGAAMDAQALLVLGMGPCSSPQAKSTSDDNSFLVTPLQLFGKGPYSKILSSIGICVFLAICHASTSYFFIQAGWESWGTIFGRVRFPSWTLVVWMLLYQGIMLEAAKFLFSPELSFGDTAESSAFLLPRILGLMVLLIGLIMPIYAAFWSRHRCSVRFVPYSSVFVGKYHKFLQYFILSSGEWFVKSGTADQQFTSVFASVRGQRNGWFVMLPFLQSWTLAVLTMTPLGECPVTSILMALCFITVSLLYLIFHPLRKTPSNYIRFAVGTLTGVVALGAVSDSIDAATPDLTLLILALSTLSTLLSLGLKVGEKFWWKKQLREKMMQQKKESQKKKAAVEDEINPGRDSAEEDWHDMCLGLLCACCEGKAHPQEVGGQQRDGEKGDGHFERPMLLPSSQEELKEIIFTSSSTPQVEENDNKSSGKKLVDEKRKESGRTTTTRDDFRQKNATSSCQNQQVQKNNPLWMTTPPDDLPPSTSLKKQQSSNFKKKIGREEVHDDDDLTTQLFTDVMLNMKERIRSLEKSLAEEKIRHRYVASVNFQQRQEEEDEDEHTGNKKSNNYFVREQKKREEQGYHLVECHEKYRMKEEEQQKMEELKWEEVALFRGSIPRQRRFFPQSDAVVQPLLGEVPNDTLQEDYYL